MVKVIVMFLVKTLNFSSASLHAPRCIRWVLANILLGVTLQWTSIPSRGGGGVKYFKWLHAAEITQDKLRPDGPLGSNAGFTLLPNSVATKQSDDI